MTDTPTSPIAGIVLAAGMATRFGANKLLAPLHGKALVRRVVEAALASRLQRVVVVLGHEQQKVRAALADLRGEARVAEVVNQAYRDGQSRSVIAGLNAVRADFPAVMFLMGDQPLLDAGTIDALIAAHQKAGTDICCPSRDGMRRNPVIFGERFFADISALTGDTGARGLIEAHPEAVTAVAFDREAPFRDVDRAGDLKVLLGDGG